jgi:cell division protein FtsZ
MAVNSSLLETSIDGARGILLNISGGSDLSLYEVNEVAEIINAAADPEANIIFGAVVDETLGDTIWVTVVAAGFDATVEEPDLEESAPAPRPAAEQQAQAAQPVAEQAPRPVPAPGVLSREDARQATRDATLGDVTVGDTVAADPTWETTGGDEKQDEEEGELEVPPFLR